MSRFIDVLLELFINLQLFILIRFESYFNHYRNLELLILNEMTQNHGFGL